MMVRKKHIETLCVHGNVPRGHADNSGSISFPIYQTATFAHPAFGQSTGYDYSRLQNPTREELERIVSGLEGGIDALAFSTGMAALSTCMELFAPGDHLIVTDDMYGGTIRLLDHISTKNGISITYIDTSDLALAKAAIRPNTAGLLVETPTNPMMKVTDLAAAAALAHQHNLLLIVDNTFMTPFFQQPLSLGADIVLHSGTKYLAGHNDTLAGFLVTARQELSERLRFLIKTSGAVLSPFDSWLVLRGLKTLALRMEKHQQNAGLIAEYLLHQGHVKKVYYTGFESHASYAVTQRQCSGYSGMISFAVDTPETAQALLGNIKLIQFAESLGGVESLITYPMYQTHADIPLEKRLLQGIDECLLRLSVGIESADDLIADLAQAFEGSEH